MADTNTRQGKRTPVTLKIKFKSETLEQFIERYAVDVSQGGIFIRTKEPLAVGTQMKFEFQLRDASPLIAGEGTVVWTRENDPSRPAIAPGMGVRFDRLADGSQTVLERILAEKAKQAPSRSGSVTAPGDASKAAMFTDTPTRVAPAPVQEALGVRSRNRHDSEQTPLPNPMPFHSDAEDFDERAFEEATKVRSLEELAAHSAGMSTDDEQLNDDAAHATKIMPPDELAIRRHNSGGRADSTLSDPPLSGPPPDRSGPIGRAIPDRDSAPGLPSPPAVEPARTPRMLDTTPSPRNEPPVGGAVPAPAPPPARQSHPGVSNPGITPPPAAEARTQLGLAPPKTQSQQLTPAASSADAVPRAVGPEPSRPAAPSRPSSAPIVIGILVAVAAAIGAVWWFVLREEVQNNVAQQNPTGSGSAVATEPGSGSALPGGSGSDVAMAGSGSDAAGSGSAMVGSGSDVAMAGSGSAMAGSADVPAGPTVDTVIASAAKGAMVEIIGTDMKGPAPFTAKLEKGKIYKARVTAAGFTVSEIEVKGGVRSNAKLELKPRIVSVTTEPAGVSIYVDGVDTRKVTPSEITLTAGQAGRSRVRLSLRRAGFRPVDKTIEASAFEDQGDTMTTAIEATLTQQQIVRPPPGGNTGGTSTGTGTTNTGGSDAGTGTTGTTGSDAGTGTTPTPTPTPTPGTGSGSATKPTTPPATGSGAQPPSGSLGGSLGGGTTPLSTKPTEPEPTWSK